MWEPFSRLMYFMSLAATTDMASCRWPYCPLSRSEGRSVHRDQWRVVGISLDKWAAVIIYGQVVK